jgi:hypothetical protein
MQATTPLQNSMSGFHHQAWPGGMLLSGQPGRQQPDGGGLAVAANTVVLGRVLGEFGQYPGPAAAGCGLGTGRPPNGEAG